MLLLFKHALSALELFFFISSSLLFLWSAIWPAYVLATGMGVKHTVQHVHDATNIWLGTDALGWLEMDGALWGWVCVVLGSRHTRNRRQQ